MERGAALVREEQAGVVCQIDSVEDITRNLVDFLLRLDNPVMPPMSQEAASRYSRQSQAGDFARLLDEVIACQSTCGSIIGILPLHSQRRVPHTDRPIVRQSRRSRP